MRRLLLISTLAVSIAVLGACQNEVKTPENKPPSTPTPAATASPAASPVASPAVKTSPEVKSTDGKNVNGNVKTTETPKAK